MIRLRRLWPATAGDQAVLVALGGLLVVGIGLRLGVVLSRSPAFLGHLDSLIYMRSARGDLFGPPGWPAGYQFFLRVMHGLLPSLTAAIVLQHALGVATALLWFLSVRLVAPAAWALLPAAVVLLAGPQIFLEHTPLAEAPFGFLVAATCYCTVRALGVDRHGWALAAGALGVATACMRSVGLVLPLLGAVWLVACTPGPARQRLLASGAVVLSAWLLLAGYVAVAKHEAGYVGPGLARTGGWAFYARVAPFADCDRFTPPPRTRALCERSAPSRRPVARQYLLIGSPAARVFGSWASTQPAEDRALTAFARAAIVHQPLDYLHDVSIDLARFWSSDDYVKHLSGLSYHQLALGEATPDPPIVDFVDQWYTTGPRPLPTGPPALLETYEAHTRVEGPVLVLLALLALVGVPLARGRRLAVGVLLLAVSVVMLIAPIASAFFDARYVVPGYGPLAAVAAIGAASLWERGAVRQRGRPRLRRRAAAGSGTGA